MEPHTLTMKAVWDSLTVQHMSVGVKHVIIHYALDLDLKAKRITPEQHESSYSVLRSWMLAEQIGPLKG